MESKLMERIIREVRECNQKSPKIAISIDECELEELEAIRNELVAKIGELIGSGTLRLYDNYEFVGEKKLLITKTPDKDKEVDVTPTSSFQIATLLTKSLNTRLVNISRNGDNYELFLQSDKGRSLLQIEVLSHHIMIKATKVINVVNCHVWEGSYQIPRSNCKDAIKLRNIILDSSLSRIGFSTGLKEFTRYEYN